MKASTHTDKTFFPDRMNATRFFTVMAICFLCLIMVPVRAGADSVMALPGGGENIMVTFDELTQMTEFPLSYRGVTYTRVEGNLQMIWNIPGMPVTRYVKSPMLATTAPVELDPGDPANRISVRLDFEIPTRFFGFSLGFNDRLQAPNGAVVSDIGSVVLSFSNGEQQTYPLSATRVLCCTETRFDYVDADDGITGNGLVESALITLDYRYDPFAPGSGYPGDTFGLKFMGIDDVTYSTTIVSEPMDIAIDIDPGKEPNVINLNSRGTVPVAVLAQGDFDALQVDPESARFGRGQAAPVRYRVKDADHDGDEDLLLYFSVQQAGIACSDTQASLSGGLHDGTVFAGTDSVQVKHCQ